MNGMEILLDKGESVVFLDVEKIENQIAPTNFQLLQLWRYTPLAASLSFNLIKSKSLLTSTLTGKIKLKSAHFIQLLLTFNCSNNINNRYLSTLSQRSASLNSRNDARALSLSSPIKTPGKSSE